MIGSLAVSLLLAAVQFQPAPSASPAAPKQIIEIRVSPFCRTLRENVFHAIAGLRANDTVIARGRALLSRMARDQSLDPFENGIGGASVAMDQYQLGEIVGNAGQNISHVEQLLAGVWQVPGIARKSDKAALVAIEHLEAVAQAQQESLNVLSGIYETGALESLISRDNGMQGALGPTRRADKSRSATAAAGASAAGGAQDLSSGELDIAIAENSVLPALQPLIDRCEATP